MSFAYFAKNPTKSREMSIYRSFPPWIPSCNLLFWGRLIPPLAGIRTVLTFAQSFFPLSGMTSSLSTLKEAPHFQYALQP